MINILKAINKFIIKMMNKFFKNIEDKIPEDLGANWYWFLEADPRDFQASNVLWKPTQEELNNLPDAYNILSLAWGKLTPVNQWCVSSCTISSLANYITLQEVIERNEKICWQKWAKLCREKMWHKWVCKWEKWDYLENAIKCVYKNWLLAELQDNWIKDEYLKIDWYAYLQANKDNIKYWISKWYPVYYAFSWNRNTWIEISRWEIKTANFTPTWWHAVTAVWYDKDYLHFINTWRPNDWAEYVWDYSVFKIKWSVLEEMLKYWLANWRGWIIYNHKDLSDNKTKMFKDYKVDNTTEAWKAVEYLTKNSIIKWVPHNDWTYLEPGRPITRLEVIVIIYRIFKLLWRAK